tara:strand:+ start:35 stop:265 length:231 start_codon:yes stop_codon:yes gene_type:complete
MNSVSEATQKNVYVDDGFVVINLLKQKIELPLSGLDTSDKLIRHVYNLSTKPKMTTDIIRRFIQIVNNECDQIRIG